MNKIFTLLFWGTNTLLTSNAFSQPTGGKVANFGIDADILSNFNVAGTWDATGSHDWFKNSNTTALGIIDTTDAASAYTHLLAGENYVFDRGMSVPRYSLQNGYVVLDARYARDYFGFSGSSGNSDLTSFTSGSKNGMAPATLTTNPGGSSVSDKCDIIDAYVHMRRNGSVVNGASSSHLIAMMATSTVSNNGNRFFDVEFYCSAITYNATSGLFSNSGPNLTGGHTVWNFNADGSIKSFGDMDVAFSFSGSAFNELSVWVWVSLSDYNSIVPQGFDFVPGNFNGASAGANYGYAKIQAKAGGSMQVWGAVNAAVTSAPSWGTCSGTLGSGYNNYNYRNYDIGAIGEAAVDLTALGIDPALIAGQNPCNPPFKRVLVKSRSSSSFTSALQDFAGPYTFLDAPIPSATISSPAVLSCSVSDVVLRPQTILAGNFYRWSTSGGNIVSGSDSTYATVSKPGKYYLQAAVYEGCPASIDSMEVVIDSLRPVATITASGVLYSNPLSKVTLFGGDPVASNTMTAFGGSMGLSYSWTGPSGFTSSLQNPVTSLEGNYNLTVTEARNGCQSSASILALRIAGAALPVRLTGFQGNLNNNKASLNWTIAENEIADRFEMERSFDGKNFSVVGVILGSQKTGNESYAFYETINNPGTVFYRIKMYDKSQGVSYSKTLAFQVKPDNNELKILSNPVADKITFSFQSNSNQQVLVKIADMNGRILVNTTLNASRGSNSVSLPLTESFSRGVYVAELFLGTETLMSKFVKQ
jgi:hypothetical protein